MDWKALLGLAAWSLTAAAEAQIAQVAPFSTRCSEAEATGFNWAKGRWEKVNFTPATFLIQKFDPARHAGAISLCESLTPEEPVILDAFATLAGCYSATKASEKPVFDWCLESYDKAEGVWRLISVACSWVGQDLSFMPEGAFVYSMLAANLSDKPTDDYKDSMKISHGRCKVVN